MARKKKQMQKQRRTKQKKIYNSTPITPENQINLKTMQQELNGALALIQQHSFKSNSSGSDIVGVKDSLANNQSLLERCKAVTQQDTSNKKPTLRIIHHFACSGGTLIAKCIAAQPNVFLLSELHPTTRLGLNTEKAAYTPRDIVTQAIYGQIPEVDSLAEKIFIQNIIETEKHVRRLGGYLVIRAHSHADYCTDKPIPEVDTVTRLLEPYFDLKHLATIRNPIDSFMSLRENGWESFSTECFDDYCGRLLGFLKPFKKDQIVKYEDFIERPEKLLFECTKKLDLPIFSDQLEYIDIFKVSGDSGRSGTEIFKRPRKLIEEETYRQIVSSKNFKNLGHIYQFN